MFHPSAFRIFCDMHTEEETFPHALKESMLNTQQSIQYTILHGKSLGHKSPLQRAFILVVVTFFLWFTWSRS